VRIEIDPQYFRPTEVDLSIGDPSRAQKKLGWRHKTGFDTLIKEMVDADLERTKLDNVRYKD
jgi:GDPmannose 4,6-dehydratase